MELAAKVAELLQASMSAHLRSRQKTMGKGSERKLLAPRDKTLLAEACRLRKEAHELDPEHESPAWAEEQGKTSSVFDTHTVLMDFYRSQGIE